MVGILLLPMATGVLYGLMSLGRKADRSEMLENAASGNNYKQFENEAWKTFFFVFYFAKTFFMNFVFQFR